jgi:hypothetical protein
MTVGIRIGGQPRVLRGQSGAQALLPAVVQPASQSATCLPSAWFPQQCRYEVG